MRISNYPIRPSALPAVVLVSVTLAAGCDYPFPGKPDPANRPVPENQVLDFAQLFRRNCAGCHGAEGLLGPAPPLNDPLFLSIIPDDELLQTLTHGRPGTPMPPFAHSEGGPLTKEQVQALAVGLKLEWLPKEPPEPAPPRYLLADPQSLSMVPGDKVRGATVFEQACSNCHGKDGKSDDHPLHDASFLALISDQALRRIIITGRPDLGMPSYRESDGRLPGFEPLTSAQIDDLVALLKSWRGKSSQVAEH